VLPLHATASGLAVLAFGPETLLRSVLGAPLAPYADGTITDPAALAARIEAAQASGVGEADRAFDNEVGSCAVPVFGADGSVTGALAVAVPITRIDEVRRNEMKRTLRESMQRVTRALGGVVPDRYPPFSPNPAD
jgi:IclR family acetate operon transcriptional repressor